MPALPSNIADFVYFALVYEFLQDAIQSIMANMMGHTMKWVSLMSLVLVTLWVLMQGYRILTGQTREPIIQIVMNTARVVVIMTAASTMSVMGYQISPLITNDASKLVHGLFTDDSNYSLIQSIDKNLAMTQVAMSVIDGVQVVESDHDTRDAKGLAMIMATFGTASPPMAAAAMLLLYEFALTLCIGLGPLFILCLLFEQTKELFRRWLFYTLGTLFSMGALALVSALALDLALRVAGALWGASFTNSLVNAGSEGLSSQALQQGGIGLLMTVLIVSVPPMAAAFFNGAMGSFMFQSAFGIGARMGSGGQQMPEGQSGYTPMRGITSERANTARAGSNKSVFGAVHHGVHAHSGMAAAPKDEVKPHNPQRT